MSKVSPYLLRERALEEQVVSSFKHRRTETASCCRCNVPVGNSVAFWKSILDSYPSHELVFWSVELKPDTSVPFDLWVGCSSKSPSFLELKLSLYKFSPAFHNRVLSLSSRPLVLMLCISSSIRLQMAPLRLLLL
ncbi:hypothetical protein Bca4012_052294 [Brassica carinata]|uniref:Uncharacterized protein n=2 Tax=Brassica oleracea TaxID=3712 RepID=A0A0D2ZPG6_BRAOL|nr:unnamed protein product [Brassica oleracea]